MTVIVTMFAVISRLKYVDFATEITVNRLSFDKVPLHKLYYHFVQIKYKA